MKNYHFINGICDEILANDIVNQLQTTVRHDDYSVTNKLSVGVKTEKDGWDKVKNNLFYRTSVVTIGNDEIIVFALRSYNTIVGFIYNNVFYEVGKYSQTTSRHIGDLKKKLELYYNRERFYEKIR